MERYTTYKASGAVWLGEIPSHWEVSKLKWNLKRNEPRNPGDVQVLSLYRELGIVPKDSRDDNHNVTSEDTSNYKYVRPGDFVVNKMKAWQGSVAVSDYEGIVSPAYYVYNFINDKFHKRYFHYLMRGCYKEEFMRISGGIRIGQWDLSGDALNNIAVIIPPKVEQEIIAKYLDKITCRIDALISEIQDSISEYIKWKDAIIFETVTKGLNDRVVFKETGVKKYGKIPESWNLLRFKFLLDVKSGDAIRNEDLSDEGLCPVFGGGERIGYTNDSNCSKGNILIGRVGARCGFTTLVESDSWATDNALIIDSSVRSDYLYYLLVAANLNSLNTSNAQPLITGTKIKNCYCVYTDNECEQEAIVNYLNDMCKTIDESIAEKNELLDDLYKFKKSLIYEVVTGKRKVV